MLAVRDNVTLLTGADVSCLATDLSGRRVGRVHISHNGAKEVHSADTVAVACGALSSALLLLRSPRDAHPDGLANGSGQVGRSYMRHDMSALAAITSEPNDTVFQKTLAFNDLYFDADGWPPVRPMRQRLGADLAGMTGRAHLHQAERIRPGCRSSRWRAIRWIAGCRRRTCRIRITASPTGTAWCISTWPRPTRGARPPETQAVRGAEQAGHPHVLLERNLYIGRDVPPSGTAHQAGTARFGTDRATSVLDLDCRAHQVDNLYLVDASFFPSIGAVNPTLTIVANAMRVAGRIASGCERRHDGGP